MQNHLGSEPSAPVEYAPPPYSQVGFPLEPIPGPSSAITNPPGPPRTLPTSKVELTVSAKNLLDLNTFSKSDPVCVLYTRDNLRTGKYVEVGRTEMVKNNLNPLWSHKFVLDYRFEEQQLIKFEIYDWDTNSNSVSGQDFLGKLECTLAEVVAAPNAKFERNLELPPGHQSRQSKLIVHSHELGQNKELVHIKLSAKGLPKKYIFFSRSAFVLISKKTNWNENGWTDVQKTEVVHGTANPSWSKFSVRMMTLTNGRPETPLKLKVIDQDGETLLGECETTFAEIQSKLQSGSGNAPFSLTNSKELGCVKGGKFGDLIVESIKIAEERSFLDYLQAGLQLHFSVAIDFTESNGHPDHPSSLHYSRNADNQYTLAIKSVGEIIQEYDSDRQFPALGFGARIPPNRTLSHEFFLNGRVDNPYCHGVDGLLQAYYHSINTVQLFGPTYFAPVINHVARLARDVGAAGNNYFVLLIITDGIICDLDATKEAIVNASQLPMSIIIVGVGDANFAAMEFLDSDDEPLQYNGRKAVRDIVQFVEMRKFVGSSQFNSSIYNGRSGGNNSNVLCKMGLAREVLAELPDQVVWWMKRKQ